MLNGFFELFGNAHFEAYIGGPVAGVLAALLFQGFGGGNSQNQAGAAAPSPINVYDFRKQFFLSHSRGGQQGDGIEAVALIAGALVAFLFLAFFPTLTAAIQFLNMTTLVFGVVSAFLGAWHGWMRSLQWWMLAVFPCVAAFACFVLIGMAFEAIDPRLIGHAGDAFHANSDRLSSILQATYQFVLAIPLEYWRWMSFIILGVFLIGACSVFALLRLLHFLALSKVAAGDHNSRWTSIAIRTRSYGSLRDMVVVIGFLIIAYWLVSGKAYLFLR